MFKDALLPVVAFEAAKLLKKYPELNAFYRQEAIEFYEKVHLGIAFDMNNGLKTVKIPDTDKLRIAEIENHIFELSNKYIDNKLSVDDLTGITFTITDLSSRKVLHFSVL